MKLLKTLSFLGLSLLVAQAGFATPDATQKLPSDIRIPKLANGKALPVQLYPSTLDRWEVYVKPLQGVTSGIPSFAPTPFADCDRVSLLFDELKMVDELRIGNLETLSRLQERLEGYEREIFSWEQQLAERAEALSTIQNQLDSVTQKQSELNREIDAAISNLQISNQALRAAEALDDDEKIEDAKFAQRQAREKMARLQTELEANQTERDLLVRRKHNIDGLRASVQGKIDGIKNARSNIIGQITALRMQLSTQQEDTNKEIKQASRDVAGYVRFKSEFAPAEYLEALARENPRYSFRYIPIYGGSLDITFPEVEESSLLASEERGSMFLNQKWTGAQKAHEANKAIAAYIEASGKSEDPAAIERALAFTDDLSGLKSVSLKLTPFGACAIFQPEAMRDLLGDFGVNFRTENVFSLSYSYSYPVKYNIRVKGSYSSERILYELYKASSSGFLVWKSAKQKFIRRLTDKQNIDIRVESDSPYFTEQDSLMMADNIAKLIAFNVARNYLELTEGQPDMEPVKFGDSGAKGTEKLGLFLMGFANPWAMWSGRILSAASSIFSHQSNKMEVDIKNFESKKINQELEFTVAFPGQLEIGDLHDAEILDR